MKMTNNKDLLSGQLVRLTAMNAETDATVLARWDLDSEYVRQLNSGPHDMNLAKKIREEIEKEQSEDPNTIAFAVRTLSDDQLIGFVAFDGINWRYGDTFVGIGIGERAYRGKGYGTDTMRVLLRYGFMELNLARVQLNTFSYNERAIRSYFKAGFVEEGRMRGMLLRNGQRWAFVYMSILREEWLNNLP